MSLKFSINLIKLCIAMLLILMVSAIAFSQPSQPVNEKESYNFISDNWAAFALVLSEVIAFLPTKFNGILHGVISLMGGLFKKKSMLKY